MRPCLNGGGVETRGDGTRQTQRKKKEALYYRMKGYVSWGTYVQSADSG